MAELMRLNELEHDGLVEGRTSRTIRITPSGCIFVRAVARVFDTFQFSAVASRAVLSVSGCKFKPNAKREPRQRAA
jgi:hypothetical protein